jgi:hypothetical protein
MDNKEIKLALISNLRIKKEGNMKTVEIFYKDLDGEEIEDKWVDISELKVLSEMTDELSFYNYFLAFLELVSQICYDKQYKG